MKLLLWEIGLRLLLRKGEIWKEVKGKKARKKKRKKDVVSVVITDAVIGDPFSAVSGEEDPSQTGDSENCGKGIQWRAEEDDLGLWSCNWIC